LINQLLFACFSVHVTDRQSEWYLIGAGSR
jgi:hypothetical protein